MRQYTPLTLTVAAGTLSSAPAAASWNLYPGWIHKMRLEIPSGHRGLTGVRIVWHGTPVVPFDPVAFIVGNDKTHIVDFEDEYDGAGLVVQGFNTDVWPHTFRCWADVNPYLTAEGPAGFGRSRRPGARQRQLAAIAGLERTSAAS